MKQLDDIFFSYSGMDKAQVAGIVSDALDGMDDGELFLEFCQDENISFDDGHLRNASFNTTRGFGLRAIIGEAVGYAHSTELSHEALKRASQTVRAVKRGHNGVMDLSPLSGKKTKSLYTDISPLGEVSFENKVKLLSEIDSYLRSKDERVKQVSASIGGEWQAVKIIRSAGLELGDIRPLVRLNISVVVEENGRMEKGSYGAGGRIAYGQFIKEESWQSYADEALRQALVNLESVAVKAGEMDVVLGHGWPGILLHEAIGHGLEGDFNRKKTSAFSDLMGKRVAAKGVTVVDDGTIPDRRGSITIDDEGTASSRTVLIEDGILVGYIQDRMNARLMGVKPTGNGRRENYECQPMPRMTNTYMLSGDREPEEIISGVKNGIYAVSFGGGQVDITSGKFVFSASEAYKIENGKVTNPVKGATIIGNGPDVLTKIKAIGNDMQLDPGIGTCGKDGQSVPVGVGQPSLLVSGLTVGGTEVL